MVVLGAKNLAVDEKLLFFHFGSQWAKHMQPRCWTMWLLERDNRVAQACSLQLAGKHLTDQQQPERDMGMVKWWEVAENPCIRDTRLGWVHC